MKSSKLLAVVLAVLSLSCASSRELARRSAVALQGGDTDAAYDWARRAIEKDPTSAIARAAMYEAVQLKASEWKVRITELADLDSVAAAEQTLEYTRFRMEADRYHAPVERDTAYLEQERALRDAAARHWFASAERNANSGRPKLACWHFEEVTRYAPRWPGIADSIRLSRERATVRVAILPLENQTGYSDLGRDLSEHWYSEIARGLRSSDVRFTRLLSLNDSWEAASRLRGRDDDAAMRAGRNLDAAWVLRGRVYGLDTDTRTDHISDFLYRKTSYRDTAGHTVTRYVQVPFEAVLRERTVRVALEYELLSTTSGRVLADDDLQREIFAHTVYTSFAAEGSCDNYCWVPPHAGRPTGEDYSRAADAEKRWKGTVPGEHSSLPAFLEQARRDRQRRQYRHEYLPSFYPGASPWFFLDDLPPPQELAFAALVADWRPVLEALRHADPVDEVDL